MNARLAEFPRHHGYAYSRLAAVYRSPAYAVGIAGAALVWILWTLADLDGTALLWQGALAVLIFMAGARHARQDAQRELQQSLRALAEASHDLRQPAHALTLYLAELHAQALPPAARRAVNDAQACAGDLENMLHNLLAPCALQASHAQPNVTTFSLDSVLARVEHCFSPLASARGVRLTVRPGGHRVHSDPAMVERILMNFTANALRHARGGRVLVACRVRGQTLRLAVYDTGGGIPQQRQQAVLAPFYAVAPTGRAHDSAGSGLGLTIVARLAQALRAPVIVRSVPGRGCMFAIELPLAAGHSSFHIAPQEP